MNFRSELTPKLYCEHIIYLKEIEMNHLIKKVLLLIAISFSLCLFPTSYSLADQDASKIAQALADRLSNALDFEDNESTPITFNVDVAKAVNNTFQDCVPFNPDNIQIRRVKGQYTIIDGTHYLFKFGKKKKDAQWAKAVIKYYRMNNTCFVGRPKSSFSFLLTPGKTTIDIGKFYSLVITGKSPEGQIPFPDQVSCKKFSPKQLRIMRKNRNYSIIDSSNQTQLFSFNKAKDEAVASLVFIRLYGFNQKCSIGGGQTGSGSQALPTFNYLTHVTKVRQKRLKLKK